MADAGASASALDASSTLARTVLSVVVVALVVGVRYAARRWQRERADDPERSLVVVGVAGVVAVATAGGVAALVVTWGLSDAIVGALVAPNSAGSTNGAAENVVLASVLLAGAYALTNFVGRVIQDLSGRAGVVDRHQRQVIYRLTQVTIYSFVGLSVISLFVENLASLVVGAGFLGIVVGMAARRTLGSMLAGFVLMFSRPFEIGDWVEIGDYDGVVTDISVVHTRLRTWSGEHVVLPNDVIESDSLVNRSREGRLRVEVEVGVDYATDVERAVATAEAALADRDELLDLPRPQAVVKRFDDSAVVLGARGWIESPDAPRRWRARTAIVTAVKEAFEREGIAIPFPQRTVSGRGSDDTPDAGAGRATPAGGDGTHTGERTEAQRATADGGSEAHGRDGAAGDDEDGDDEAGGSEQ
jgi:small-conductance mechanosensitive channel